MTVAGSALIAGPDDADLQGAARHARPRDKTANRRRGAGRRGVVIMTVPRDYRMAGETMTAFLQDVKAEAGLWSSHAAFTMAQGVLQVFRRRLSLEDAIRFAGVLPAGLRALFVADWEPREPQRPFAALTDMNAEVRALRPHHNFATETAIEEVAVCLIRHCDAPALRRVLAAMPAGALEFWFGAGEGTGVQ